MLKHYKHSIKESLSYWRIVLILYFLQFIIAIPFGLQVYQVIHASIGNSLELDKLLYNYDHTIYSDFLSVHGASVTPLIGQLRWVILSYFIISVFLHAGVLYCIEKKEKTWISFWNGASHYFFSFLKIGLVFSFIFIIWSVIIWLPAMIIFRNGLELLPSEKYFLLICLIAAIIYIAGMLFLFNASLASRFHVLQNKKSWIGAIRSGIKWTIRTYRKSTFLLLLFLLTAALITTVYLGIENLAGMVSPVLIIDYFLVQQAYVIFRNYWRIVTYKGIHSLYLESVE